MSSTNRVLHPQRGYQYQDVSRACTDWLRKRGLMIDVKAEINRQCQQMKRDTAARRKYNQDNKETETYE